MTSWMKTAAIGIVAAGLFGCEGAVLVNNRPEREGRDWNQPAATPSNDAQNASATVGTDENQAQPASVQVMPDDANTSAPATRPADQKVQTGNTKIESSSD